MLLLHVCRIYSTVQNGCVYIARIVVKPCMSLISFTIDASMDAAPTCIGIYRCQPYQKVLQTAWKPCPHDHTFWSHAQSVGVAICEDCFWEWRCQSQKKNSGSINKGPKDKLIWLDVWHNTRESVALVVAWDVAATKTTEIPGRLG